MHADIIALFGRDAQMERMGWPGPITPPRVPPWRSPVLGEGCRGRRKEVELACDRPDVREWERGSLASVLYTVLR